MRYLVDRSAAQKDLVRAEHSVTGGSDAGRSHPLRRAAYGSSSTLEGPVQCATRCGGLDFRRLRLGHGGADYLMS